MQLSGGTQWLSMECINRGGKPVTELTGDQRHRAAGVLLTMAAGDALGAGYEFGGPYPADMAVQMKGGGAFNWGPGEWTDDTQMALVIAEAALAEGGLLSEAALDRIAQGWAAWMSSAADVGAQTRTVISAAVAAASEAAVQARAASVAVVAAAPVTAAHLAEQSELLHAHTGHTAGNGSLMRTAPVALAYLHDPAALTQAATTISQLTHHDPEAAEACGLWCHLIRLAVLTGELRAAEALAELPAERARVWAQRLDEAAHMRPADFTANGWVVEALQAAWCSIVTTANGGEPDAPSDPHHVRRALEAAVRGGRDTDTVAAIAGGLLGGLYGASAVPAQWRRVLHGWPGLRTRDLIAQASLIAAGGAADAAGWPITSAMDYSSFGGTATLVRHPHDDGVWLGGVGALRNLPDGVDAVVSLCRLGAKEAPAAGVSAEDHVEVWLVDTTTPADNPHLHFVLSDAASAVGQLRDEGKTVLLHCVQAQSRTPTVAALHSVALGVPWEDALAQVCAVLPDAAPNRAFLAAIAELVGY